ncbi:MAG: VWA domain-containing protein [Candidatus Obscuribacterales bacterium]|nr:VWA domain-containing protein [Candidatus Obscuribacterales bacterium]
MKAKTIGLLAVGTIVLSTCAGMKLAAKDLGADSTPETTQVREQKKEAPRMDLAFCIDTTGSMQGEIEMVKTKVKEMVAKLSGGKPTPIVRVGLVAFRDRGDQYVTKAYQFTDDIDKFVQDISDLKADGGGDGPEAVNEALHESINNLQWDTSKKTAKLLFLIGDAEPHFYSNDFRWQDESKDAISKGIQINTLGCNGLESSGEGVKVFQQIAKLSDGTFENLAYRQIVKDESGRETTRISSGGKSYEVAASASTEWKKGAYELSRAGMAKPVARPVRAAAPMMYASSSAGMASFGAGASAGASLRTGKAMPAGGAAAEGYYADSAPVDRKDSNLDSLMYDAALKKARDKLNVEYNSR